MSSALCRPTKPAGVQHSKAEHRRNHQQRERPPQYRIHSSPEHSSHSWSDVRLLQMLTAIDVLYLLNTAFCCAWLPLSTVTELNLSGAHVGHKYHAALLGCDAEMDLLCLCRMVKGGTAGSGSLNGSNLRKRSHSAKKSARLF